MKETLFSGDKYVILSIKPKEIDWLLEFASRQNLKINYPNLFDAARKENKELFCIYIDDESIGGIVSTTICHHEVSINKTMKIFRNVDELISKTNLPHKRKG